MTGASTPDRVDRLPTVGIVVRGMAVLGLAAVMVLAVTNDGGTAAGRLSGGYQGTGFVASTVGIGGYLPAAIEAVEREREQLRREREAFDRFEAEVKSITVRTDGTNGISPVQVGHATTTRSKVREVENAYRTTVMAVDHFDREYGEELRENMALELSEHVASAVTNGNQFSQPLKQATIQQSRFARSRRESLLQTVTDERDALERSRNRIREIEAPLETDPAPSTRTLTDLFDYERRLRRCLTRYERLLRERQREIHAGDQFRLDTDRPFLQPYLYDSLEVDFPVLATVADRCERLRDRRRAIHREITYR